MEEKMESRDNELLEEEQSKKIEKVLAPLRALETALSKRIRVKTSFVKLPDENQSNERQELLDIDGLVTDERTLQFLEESISDIASTCETSELAEKTEKSVNEGSFYSLPSCSSNFEGVVSPESLESAHRVIADLEANGPAGLVHLSSLSAEIGRPLRVWSSGGKNSRMVGRSRIGGEAVDIEYHEAGPDEPQGHWTLRDNVEPRDTEGQLNDCLFSVVADQIDSLAPELRQRTIARMRAQIRSLAHRIDAISKEENCERISLLIGGARYQGRKPQDAAEILDASQNALSFSLGGRQPTRGHPRGHASDPTATGSHDSAENYSRTTGGRKTAFLSRTDQDCVAHLVLETDKAQNAMQRLNDGADQVSLRLKPSDLQVGALPQAVDFINGKPTGSKKPFKQLVIVLRQHLDQYKNPDADVFVHTFYPIIL